METSEKRFSLNVQVHNFFCCHAMIFLLLHNLSCKAQKMSRFVSQMICCFFKNGIFEHGKFVIHILNFWKHNASIWNVICFAKRKISFESSRENSRWNVTMAFGAQTFVKGKYYLLGDESTVFFPWLVVKILIMLHYAGHFWRMTFDSVSSDF